jgi:uncharacterized protein (TIGR00730 family)
MKRLCVFCGSSFGARPEFALLASEVGALLAERGIGLVYGGGRVGLMGVLADSVLAGGGEVIGVIPKALADWEVAHKNLTDLRIVSTMHERKALMHELSDGFIALPGGLGTYEELFEIATWGQLGIHAKPIGLLDVAGYFDPLKEMIARGVEEQFIRPEHAALLLTASSPIELLDTMVNFQPQFTRKWIELEES